jgi:hypothetical protein
MRLWSLHPKYLDTKGLVACWREGLLARKVLLGETRGYRNHPQLERFRRGADPVALIDRYLHKIADEGQRRGYKFDRDKLEPERPGSRSRLKVTKGQLIYELRHLRSKLAVRDPDSHRIISELHVPLAHPLFRMVPGEIEPWERTS